MPTKSQIDSIVSVSTDVQTKFAALILYFIKLVKDCSLISKNDAFMKNLLETNSILCDFVKRMEAAMGILIAFCRSRRMATYLQTLKMKLLQIQVKL